MSVKKKIPKASKHRLMIFGTLSIVLMGYFLFTLINYTMNINKLKEEQKQLQAELVSLKDDAEDLSTVIQKLKDPDYVARYARENYLYSKNGEYIIKIEEKPEKKVTKKNNNSNYQYYIGGSVICMIGIFLYILKRK